MSKCVVILSDEQIINMLDEMYVGNATKVFNNMNEKTKIDILEGVREDYESRGYERLNINTVIDELAANPYKYLAYCSELQDHIITKFNDLKSEYEDLEDKIEDLYSVSDIIPDTDKYINQLTEKLNELDSTMSLANDLNLKADWKGLAELFKVKF